MARQGLLFTDGAQHAVGSELAASELTLLSWNVQSPSLERAQKQFQWLLETKANVIALTELRSGKGSEYLASSLEASGFQVLYDEPAGREYATLVAGKGFALTRCRFDGPFKSRVMATSFTTSFGELTAISLYAPSHSPDEAPANAHARSAFQQAFAARLKALRAPGQANSCLVVGDLNVVERAHVPPQSIFGDADYDFYDSFTRAGLRDVFRETAGSVLEHSWFGPLGERQRIDHAFASRSVFEQDLVCRYEHRPRLDRLSDHSALMLQIRRRAARA
jgi:exodeoxyribonuclease-3